MDGVPTKLLRQDFELGPFSSLSRELVGAVIPTIFPGSPVTTRTSASLLLPRSPSHLTSYEYGADIRPLKSHVFSTHEHEVYAACAVKRFTSNATK